MSREINGLPIVNATKKLILNITPKDIKTAKPKRPDCCVVAQACKRELHAQEARVHLGRVYLKLDNKKWLRFLTPGSLRSEIIAFDRGGDFSLGEHVLGRIGPVKASGKRQGTNKDRNLKAPQKRKKLAGPRHVVTGVRDGAPY